MIEWVYIALTLFLIAILVALALPRVRPQPLHISTKTVANLIQRVGELETQLESERQACAERVQSVMRQMLKANMRLDMLDGGEVDNAGEVRLYNEIIDHLGEDEIRLLAFDMHVHYEAFSGDNAHARALSMIVQMKREGRVGDMVKALQARRPDVQWGK